MFRTERIPGRGVPESAGVVRPTSKGAGTQNAQKRRCAPTQNAAENSPPGR